MKAKISLERLVGFAVVGALFALLCAVAACTFNSGADKQMNSLIVHLPFVFSEAIDPRAVVTVGDQVVCEHVFAFHGRESIKSGFSPVISDVEFNERSNKAIIRPRFPLKTASGAKFDISRMCAAVKASMAGTSHAPIATLVTGVDCGETQIEVSFRALPVNIRYLFTLADFSIFDPAGIPLNAGSQSDTTGPFTIRAQSNAEIRLERNPNYPQELRANSIQEVFLRGYSASQSRDLIKKSNPKDLPLAYFYGYALTRSDLDMLKEHGYRVRQMPSEWMVYFGIQEQVPMRDRMLFANQADAWRQELLTEAPLGQAAYSLSPQDRPFGLTENEYRKALGQKHVNRGKLSRKYLFATLDEWAEIPLFKKGIELVRRDFPGVAVKLFSRRDISKLWSKEVDLVISPMGIAPADPLNNFAFLEELGSVVTRERIAEISTVKDASLFNQALLEIEKRVASQRLWVPIGHFPGVVAEAPGFERDENLAWSWGIQAWTYRIRSSL